MSKVAATRITAGGFKALTGRDPNEEALEAIEAHTARMLNAGKSAGDIRTVYSYERAAHRVLEQLDHVRDLISRMEG
jgi:hypothetical protein